MRRPVSSRRRGAPRLVLLSLLLVVTAIVLAAGAGTAAAAGYVWDDQWPVLGDGAVGGVTCDDHGGVYVAMYDGAGVEGPVRKYSTDGTFITNLGQFGSGVGQLSFPWDVAIARNGHVYVTDINLSKVVEYDESGRFVREFGSYGTGDGQFNMAAGIALDGYGRIYVSDTGNARINVFATDGTWLGSFGGPGTDPGQFQGIWSLDVDAQDRVYATDTDGGRIQVFDTWDNGNTYLGGWAVHGPDGSGGPLYASWVSVRDDGHVFVSTFDAAQYSSLEEWTFDGTTAEYVDSLWSGWGGGPGEFGNRIYGIDWDRRGDLFACDGWTQRIQKFAWDDVAPTFDVDYDGSWRNEDFSIDFGADDALAGLDLVEYRFDGWDWQPGGFLTIAGVESHGYDGVWPLVLHAVDTVGNERTRTISVRVDTRPPRSRVDGLPTGWVDHPVTVEFSAFDAGSGVNNGAWKLDDDLYYTIMPVDGQLTIGTEGAHTLYWWMWDNALPTNNHEDMREAQVLIDMSAPVPLGLANATVVRGRKATLRYQVDDTYSPTAAVKIVVKQGTSKKLSFALGQRPTNAPQAKSFICKLPRGKYKWYVYATDLAGNPQATVAVKTLTVK
jgi:hypothetical protein